MFPKTALYFETDDRKLQTVHFVVQRRQLVALVAAALRVLLCPITLLRPLTCSPLDSRTPRRGIPLANLRVVAGP